MKRLRTAIIIAAVSMAASMGFAQEIKMVKIPGMDIKMSATEITQKQYESVMGEDPSYFYHYENDILDYPVEYVSWYDAIYFCNKLSVKEGKTPVYAVDGETDVKRWGYTPHNGNAIKGKITQNKKANGYRLPTLEEWKYAAKGGQNYRYSGSANVDAVAWYDENSDEVTHPVAKKKANGYGLYDMSGNVWEWCWDSSDIDGNRCVCGGGSLYYAIYCEVDRSYSIYASRRDNNEGFRIVCHSN